MRFRPKLLYHGTTREFHDGRIARFGRYQNYDYVDLDYFTATCISYALQRSRQYRAKPILLVVKTSLVTSNLTWEPWLRCEYLETDWYRIVDLDFDGNVITPDTLIRLEKTEEEVKKLGTRRKKPFNT